MFNQGYGGTVAQKVGQGNQVLVQIGLLSHRGRCIRHSIGVSIYSTPDGVSVSTGQANWFDDPGLGGSLIGALYWPPLLLSPLARGIKSYGLYQDIWQAVDTYCAQVGAMQGAVTTALAVYCHNCGVVNYYYFVSFSEDGKFGSDWSEGARGRDPGTARGASADARKAASFA